MNLLTCSTEALFMEALLIIGLLYPLNCGLEIKILLSFDM